MKMMIKLLHNQSKLLIFKSFIEIQRKVRRVSSKIKFKWLKQHNLLYFNLLSLINFIAQQKSPKKVNSDSDSDDSDDGPTPHVRKPKNRQESSDEEEKEGSSMKK